MKGKNPWGGGAGSGGWIAILWQAFSPVKMLKLIFIFYFFQGQLRTIFDCPLQWGRSHRLECQLFHSKSKENHLRKVNLCYSIITCKVLFNWTHSKLGQYCTDSLPNLGKRITRRCASKFIQRYYQIQTTDTNRLSLISN